MRPLFQSNLTFMDTHWFTECGGSRLKAPQRESKSSSLAKHAEYRMPGKIIKCKAALAELTSLASDTMMDFQELAEEAFRDLLKKHGRPVDLKDALKRSAREGAPPLSNGARKRPSPKSG
jgi:hypothetical protein